MQKPEEQMAFTPIEGKGSPTSPWNAAFAPFPILLCRTDDNVPDAPEDRRGPGAALTAYSRPEDRAKSMLAGFDAHLSKPVDLTELIATVVRLISRRLRDISARA
jgi:hypothetical protein